MRIGGWHQPVPAATSTVAAAAVANPLQPPVIPLVPLMANVMDEEVRRLRELFPELSLVYAHEQEKSPSLYEPGSEPTPVPAAADISSGIATASAVHAA